MEKISTITEQPFAKAWGRSSSLILPRSSMWKSVKKSKHRNVSSATYNIYDPLYENRTYYGSTTDLENLIAFPKATMKLQTVKGGSSIKNLRI